MFTLRKSQESLEFFSHFVKLSVYPYVLLLYWIYQLNRRNYMKEETLGMRLRKLRIDRNISQVDFATSMNIRNTTLCMYESDNRIPSDATKKKIADFFGVSLDYLITGESQKDTSDNRSNTQLSMSFEKLTPAGQQAVMEYIDLIHIKETNEKKTIAQVKK